MLLIHSKSGGTSNEFEELESFGQGIWENDRKIDKHGFPIWVSLGGMGVVGWSLINLDLFMKWEHQFA